MLLKGRIIFTLALLIGAGLLSIVQAWALATPPPRTGRHLAAWVVSSLGLALVGLAFFYRWPWNGPPSDSVETVLILAGITAAVALWVGSRVGKAMPGEDSTARRRAFVLFGPHVVVVMVLGALSFFFLYATALGKIH